MAKEYIDREAVLKFIQDGLNYPDRTSLKAFGHDAIEIMAEVQYMPAADVAPVVHGWWVPMSYDGYADGNPVWDEFECSICGHEHSGDDDTLTAYCPDCGAKMDGDDSNG